MPPIAVLAGGLGTRLYPATTTIPKSLIEVAGTPFVVHQLKLFSWHGIHDVVFCVGHFGDQIENFVQDGSRFNLRVRYSYDGDRLRGTGGALMAALPLLGEEFLVTYGDAYLDINYNQVIDAFRASHAPALMTVYQNDDNWDKSNVELRDGLIAVYDKKNRTSEMRYIDYGLLALQRAALDDWADTEVFDLDEPLGVLAKAKRLAAFETTTRFYEVGSVTGIDDLIQHLRAINDGDPSCVHPSREERQLAATCDPTKATDRSCSPSSATELRPLK